MLQTVNVFIKERSAMNGNSFIGLTKSDLSPQNWVDRSDVNQTLLVFKYS